MRRAVVLLNERAGSGADADQLSATLRRNGVLAPVSLVPPRDLTRAARDHARAGARIVAAAGGDGTASAVAAGILGTSAALGVLPLGTRNHFARDLGIPRRIPRAARLLRSHRARRVDVGRVNGRPFLNNAGIGLYPRWVLQRELLREGRKTPKGLSALVAVGAVLRRYSLFHVRLAVDDRIVSRRAPFVFVGNNVYRLHGQRVGGRRRLDAGLLSVVLADGPTRVDLVRLAARSLLQGLRPGTGLVELRRREAWIHTSKKALRVAIDGEVVRLRTPLHFESEPKALRVVAP